jgi:hypothetical protein
MQLFLLFALWAQLILSALASTDTSSRDTGMIQYLVYPVTGALPAENTDTETRLNELCGAANVSPVRPRDEQLGESTAYWNVTLSRDSDMITKINDLIGVGFVRQAKSPNAPTAQHEHRGLVRRDVQSYMARAKNTSDVQETEKFLKSKVQKGTSLLHHRNDGKVTGWYGLMLDDQAKSEVEKYEGIESIMIEGKLEQFFPPSSVDRDDPARPTSEIEQRSEEHGSTQPAISLSPSQNEYPDLVRRDVQRYVALAKTNSDMQETERFLKSKMEKDSTLLYFEADNKTIGWYGLMLDHEAFLEVKEYEGIEAIRIDGKMVEFYPPASGDQADPAQPISGVEQRSGKHDYTESSASGFSPSQIEHPDLSRRDVREYIVLATNISSLQTVEDFLKSKVQKGTVFRGFLRNNNDVAVWHSVALDDEAKAAVEKYEGVQSVRVPDQGEFFGALPFPHNKYERQAEHGRLLPRDTQWAKQTNADKALVMDSQYE